MSEDDKGRKFLELIDEQNNLQWSIIEKLIFLINALNGILLIHKMNLNH